MLIISARVDPVTSGPVPVANGPRLRAAADRERWSG